MAKPTNTQMAILKQLNAGNVIAPVNGKPRWAHPTHVRISRDSLQKMVDAGLVELANPRGHVCSTGQRFLPTAEGLSHLVVLPEQEGAD